MIGMDDLNIKASSTSSHESNDTTPSLIQGFSEQELEQEARQEQPLLKSSMHTSPGSPTIYSLRSAASTLQRVPTRRSIHHPSSSPTSATPSASNSSTRAIIHPSDHMKTLLSQLQSSVSSSKAAFALYQASSAPCHASAEADFNRARHAIAEELHTLSSLHMRLYSLTQEHDISVIHEQDSAQETGESPGTIDNIHGQRQEAMLKSYEGVINRFHDEIRKKEAVTEALKETLARSMLRGEKLERRMRALEAQLGSTSLFQT